MKNKLTSILLSVLFILALPGICRAQSTSLMTVSGNFSAFSPGSNTAASSDIGAAFQLTTNFSAGYNQVTIPSLNRSYRLGIINYTRNLSDLLGANLSKKFVFDTSNIMITFQGGAGKVTQTGINAFNNISETGGIFLSYPIATHASLQLIGAQWLHGGSSPSNAVFSTGINFNF